MKREILVEDGIGGEHMIKYIDKERVAVQKVMRNDSDDLIYYSLLSRVPLRELDSWPYTESLKTQISEFHAQFPDAK
tara:strand:- start:194 stop:424 length:231 start_codon:yes stop_codon:yes gene_type:complete